MKTTFLSQTIAAIALLTLPAFGYAQDNGEGSKWTITPRAGITLSTLTGNDADDYDTRLGFGGGMEAEYHLNKNIELDARYLWNVTDINDIETVDGGNPAKQHNSTFLITLGYYLKL